MGVWEFSYKSLDIRNLMKETFVSRRNFDFSQYVCDRYIDRISNFVVCLYFWTKNTNIKTILLCHILINVRNLFQIKIFNIYELFHQTTHNSHFNPLYPSRRLRRPSRGEKSPLRLFSLSSLRASLILRGSPSSTA